MYMQFYWVIDRVKQKHFGVFWKPEVINLRDFLLNINRLIITN